ncbi:hypothetical protein DFA_03480 [Cavenderia fasciculata]|uniref:Transmembrane protein n=1 Tax=Cavenderia fasciculata TaxID=261658 RepID=F4PHP8_CACFS|nr:uncharacterized protein DFA_03480 [Cavenderia fasciculata]EGG25232.1 hypothetical protein DFA_03480 [Cavenderia fasciculata]|eukprot:XP_004363083.1 hypothetical protein DFA_03480 [Cavenderia fasciculata]
MNHNNYNQNNNNNRARTIVHNGQIKQINSNKQDDLDDVDVQFHFAFTKDNIISKCYTCTDIFFVIEFGAFFFISSCAVLMVKNLGKREKGHQGILGSVSRQQLEGEMGLRYKPE